MKQESSLRVTENDQIVAGVVLDVLADEGELLESLEEPFNPRKLAKGRRSRIEGYEVKDLESRSHLDETRHVESS